MQIIVLCLITLSVCGTVTLTAADGSTAAPEAIPLTVDENILVSDSHELLPPIYLIVNENIVVSDSPEVLPAVALTVNENIAVSDSPEVLPPVSLTVNETIIVSDVTQVIPAAPTISSFTPTLGGKGTSVIINGTGFDNASAVSFGGTDATSYTISPDGTSITAVVGIGSTGAVSVTTPSGTATSIGCLPDFLGVWGSSGHDVFATSKNGTIKQYDGSAWSQIYYSDLSGGYLEGVWGSSGHNVFVVGTKINGSTFVGTILHYNGTAWNTAYFSTTSQLLVKVWGSSGSDVFAVGGDISGMTVTGIVLHYNGTTWSQMDLSHLSIGMSSELGAVWGSAWNDVFAVGLDGTILHYDGGAWTAMYSGTSEALEGVWGTAWNDVFVVGMSGTILHYDGSAWTKMDSGTGEGLAGVWGSSWNDIFATGQDGTILHYNGNPSGVWTKMDSGTGEALAGVWGSSPSDIFAVGFGGTILHWNSNGWGGESSNTFTFLKNTRPGSGVNVALGGGNSITFAQVTTDGETKATPQTDPQVPNFMVVGGTCYDITTSAIYMSPITISLHYNDSGMTVSQELALKLLHFQSGQWVDVTTGVGTTNNIISGEVDSLSPFVIAYPTTFTLTYTAEPGGSITGAASQTVNYGGSGSQVTATPYSCYHFVSWSDGVKTVSRTDTVATTVTANFAINTYTLTYTAGAGGSISGKASQTINCGSSGTAVTATPATGYHFVSWSDGITTASRTDKDITADIKLTSKFAINTFTITASANPAAGGTVSGTGIYNSGSKIKMIATAATFYHFVNWSEGTKMVSTSATYSFTATADRRLVANFAFNNPAPKVTFVFPTIGLRKLSAIVTISGTGFLSEATVTLEKDGKKIKASSVTVIFKSLIICTFKLQGAAVGSYDVVVTNPDSQVSRLNKSFTVK